MARRAGVTPDELRKFAADLQRFNNEVADERRRIIFSFQQLGDTWKDQEHQQFAAEFERTMKALKAFLSVSNEYVPFLRKKAELADQYIDLRRSY